MLQANDANDEDVDRAAATTMTAREFESLYSAEARVQTQVFALLHSMVTINRYGFLFRNIKTRYFYCKLSIQVLS
jgi:hypothetical protein